MFKKKNIVLLTSLLMTGITIKVSAGKGSFEPSSSPAPAPQPTVPTPTNPSSPAANDPNHPYYDLGEMDETNKKQTKLLQLLAGGGSALATAVGGLGMYTLQTVVSNKTKNAMDKKQVNSSAFFPNNSKKIADKEIFLEGISNQLENNKKDSQATLYSSEPDKAGLLNTKNKKAEAHAIRIAREKAILDNLEQEVAKEKAHQFKLRGDASLEAREKAAKIIENDMNDAKIDEDVSELNEGEKIEQGFKPNKQADSIEQLRSKMSELNNQAAIHNHLESYYLSMAEGAPNHELLNHPEVHTTVQKGKKEFLEAVIHTPSVYKHLAPETKIQIHQEVREISRAVERPSKSIRERA